MRKNSVSKESAPKGLERSHCFIVNMGRTWMLANQPIGIDCSNTDTFGRKQSSESKSYRP